MKKQKKSLPSKKIVTDSTQPVLSEIEIERAKTIERNIMKMKELGFEKLVGPYMDKAKINVTKGKEKVNGTVTDDVDYVPDDDQDSEDEFFKVSEDVEVEINGASCSRTKSSASKKAATKMMTASKRTKKALCPAMAMDDFVNMQQQKDPAEAHDLELEVQILEQKQRRSSKRIHSAIIASENQEELVETENQENKFD